MELVPPAAVEAVAEVVVLAQGTRFVLVQALVIRDPVAEAAVVHDPVVALDQPVVPRHPAPAVRAVNQNKFSLIKF